MLTEIAEDIGKIKQIVKKEVCCGHKMLEEPLREPENAVFLSLLLLTSAKFGQYPFDKLEPVAVGLELLNFGVKKHYQASIEDGLQNCAVDDLSLISGDYFYSKGIFFASQLDASFVIEIMSRAIVDITEAQVELDSVDKCSKNYSFEKYWQTLSKQAALYRAACKLGTLLGQVDSKVSRSLEKFGQLAGIIYGFSENNSWRAEIPDIYRKNIVSLIDDAKRSVQNLPENKYRFFLTELAEELM